MPITPINAVSVRRVWAT